MLVQAGSDGEAATHLAEEDAVDSDLEDEDRIRETEETGALSPAAPKGSAMWANAPSGTHHTACMLSLRQLAGMPARGFALPCKTTQSAFKTAGTAASDKHWHRPP